MKAGQKAAYQPKHPRTNPQPQQGEAVVVSGVGIAVVYVTDKAGQEFMCNRSEVLPVQG